MKLKLMKNHKSFEKGKVFEVKNISYSNGNLIFRDEEFDLVFNFPAEKMEVVKEVH